MKNIISLLCRIVVFWGFFGILISCGRGVVTNTLSVDPEVTVLTGIELTPSAYHVPVQAVVSFEVVALYSDNTHKTITPDVAWETSNTNVARFNVSGLMPNQAKSFTPGTIQVVTRYEDKAATIYLTVTSAQLQTITVNPPQAAMPAGLSQQMTATGTYNDSSTADITHSVTWSSSNSSVATVSNLTGTQGLLNSVASGVTVVTATLGAYSGQAGISVSAATLTGLSISPTNPHVAKGFSQQFTATGTYSDSTTQDVTLSVSWNSSNSSIATISNTAGTQGKAEAKNTGTSIVSASLGNVSS
ncbi:MAG: Ig-like domain-containing protein, partial [Bdellovibrio sp.]